MTRFFTYSAGKGEEHEFSRFEEIAPTAEFLWVHIDGRTDDVASVAARAADIPPTAFAALSASETRPRVAPYDHGALLNMRGLGAQDPGDGDPLVSIRMWAQQGRVVSLSYRSLDALDGVIVDMLAGRIKDPGDLISGVAMGITEQLDPYIADLGDELDTIESHISDDGHIGVRHRVTQLRAGAISYRRFLSPQRSMMERLVGLPCHWLEPDDRLHIQEAADRCARMVEELEAVRERSALAHEALTDLRAEHMNRQALILAVVALIFLPLTFITGLLGMNVEGIPYAHAPWAFWGVVGFCVAIGLIVGIWFKVTHWLQK